MLSDSVEARPYQLMCLVCRLGRSACEPFYFETRLNALSEALRADPNRPLMLRCNVSSVYAWQNPGRAYDTPEGDLFNDKRDLDIVHALGLVPGDTHPAMELFNSLYREIPVCQGICGYGAGSSPEWRGCRYASSGNYERGHALGVSALLPPRGEKEKADAKRDSVAAMRRSARLLIRPHHLLCMTCFHKGQTSVTPIVEDNLCEAIEIVQHHPDIPITLIEGPCMICPPCSGYDPARNRCVSGIGMGLRDQKKDLDLLQRLGLTYGATMPAREMFRLVYARIHSTRQICGYDDGKVRAPEWTICGGPDGSPNYVAGRAAGLGIPGLTSEVAKSQSP